MTTAPFPGQPTAARPAVPSRRHGGLLAVLGTALVIGAALGANLALHMAPVAGAIVAGSAMLAFAGAVLVVLRRERTLAGALETSQVAFRTLVTSSVDPVVVFSRPLVAEQLSAGAWRAAAVPAVAS